jgi:hypothetical protein
MALSAQRMKPLKGEYKIAESMWITPTWRQILLHAIWLVASPGACSVMTHLSHDPLPDSVVFVFAVMVMAFAAPSLYLLYWRLIVDKYSVIRIEEMQFEFCDSASNEEIAVPFDSVVRICKSGRLWLFWPRSTPNYIVLEYGYPPWTTIQNRVCFPISTVFVPELLRIAREGGIPVLESESVGTD